MLNVIEYDQAERLLTGMHEATGVRQVTCPWQALRDPFVVAVMRAYRHWKQSELGTRMAEVPEALMRGIEVYDAALNAVTAHDMRADAKRRDDENAARAVQHAEPRPQRSLPAPRRRR